MGDDARREGDLRRAGPPPRPGRGDHATGSSQNRIYQQISGALAGSQEYMAMEKLLRAPLRGRLRPARARHPAQPQRARLPRRAAAAHPVHRGPLAAGLHAADRARRQGRRARRHRRVLGAEADPGFDLLADLSEFFTAFSGMVDGFQERARRVNELLADPAPASWWSAARRGSRSPRPSTSTASWWRPKLPFGGVIVNKVHYPSEHLRGNGEDLVAALEDGARRRRAGRAGGPQLRRLPGAGRPRPAATSSTLPRELRTRSVIQVPYLDEDVHDLAGLAEINRYLFASGRERAKIAAAAPVS